MTRLRALALLVAWAVLWVPANLIGRGEAVAPLVVWGVHGLVMARGAR